MNPRLGAPPFRLRHRPFLVKIGIAQFFWRHLRRAAPLLVFVAGTLAGFSAELFRVATYNVETYLNQPTETRKRVKSPEARAKIRESIRAINPDVLALEEIGDTNALMELRGALQAEGQVFADWEFVPAFDTNIHLAVLSKFPIVGRRAHTNDAFLLDGRKFQVKRGFAEVDIQAAPNFTFTLVAAHLKSRLGAGDADEAEERLGEAKVLRSIIDGRLARDPQARLVVLGDFNDTPDSATLKEIIGRGKGKLTDTRPAERNGDIAQSGPTYEARDVTWTYFYGKDDTYSRFDYLLISPGMKQNWRPSESRILAISNWGTGSDHRPIEAGFQTSQKSAK